ncbi:MAG TPA: hypothetical protein PLQ76_00285 [bacterium]|nr:hypothetical protein [bacterium]
MDSTENYEKFIREHFTPLRIKGLANVFMGKKTAKIVLAGEKRKRLSHLSPQKADTLIEKYDLKKFSFDNGRTYVVNLNAEKKTMLDFYAERSTEDAEDEGVSISDIALSMDEDIPEKYFISEIALEIITGDTPAILEMEPDAAVDFISTDEIVAALDENKLRLHNGEGFITVLANDEEVPDSDNYLLILDRPLPGSEISLEELDLKRRTAIDGSYRDDVSQSGHDFEHMLTNLEE